MIRLKKILVPTDFSEPADAALRYGVELADTLGATVHVLHVVTEPVHAAWAGYTPTTQFRSAVEHFESEATRRLDRLPINKRARVVRETAVGEPAEEILKYAIAHQIDLIVCGTHGRQGWEHFMMGSVAERLVREAPCPVLAMQKPEATSLPRRATAPIQPAA